MTTSTTSPSTSPAEPLDPSRARRLRLGAAVAVVAATAVSWGGRIGLLTDGELTAFGFARIAGSLVLGLVTAWALWRGPGWLRMVALVFAGWTALIWVRAVITAWIDPPSLPFALVHTALGMMWLGVVVAVLRASRSHASAVVDA